MGFRCTYRFSLERESRRLFRIWVNLSCGHHWKQHVSICFYIPPREEHVCLTDWGEDILEKGVCFVHQCVESSKVRQTLR